MSFSITVTTTVQEDSDAAETVATRTFSGLTAEDRYKEVVNNSAVTLWDPTVAGVGIADFDLLLLFTDVEVEIEFTCNEADADEELVSLTLAANTCLVLGSDASRYTYSTDAFAGTLDVLDKLRVKELNSVNATVEARFYT